MNQKKVLSITIVGLLALLGIAQIAQAVTVPWQKNGTVLEPLPTSRTDEVRLPYLTGTSTQQSNFAGPLSANGLTSTNGLTVSGGSLDAQVSAILGSGLGNIVLQSPLISTSGATSTFAAPISINGWIVATSTCVSFYPTNCPYQISRTSTSSQTVINRAILDVHRAGGGIVDLKFETATATISDLIQVYSNVHLRGQGKGATIIAADVGYNPVSDCPNTASGFCMITNADATSSSTPSRNIEISGITFDQNGQNRYLGHTPNGSDKVVDFMWVDNFRFHDNKVLNGLNYAVFVHRSSNVWIERNDIRNGWAPVESPQLDQQDGIHLRSVENFFILNNSIDTIDQHNGGIAGDDAIAVCSSTSQSDRDVIGGVISGNVIYSGSRGILLCQEGDYNVRSVTVANNQVLGARGSGILLLHYGDANYGKFYNINIIGNTIYDYGQDPTAIDTGIGAFYDSGATKVKAFDTLNVIGNAIQKSTTQTTIEQPAVAVFLKGNNLKVNDNTATSLLGRVGFYIGGASAPIKDGSILGNTIDCRQCASDQIAMFLFGTEGFEVGNNTIHGNKTGNTQAIRISGGGTVTIDVEGNSNAEVSAYNDVHHNHIYDYDNGIVEGNGGSIPAQNTLNWNTFRGVTTKYTKLGADTVVIGEDGSTLSYASSTGNIGIGTTTPGSPLSIQGIGNFAAPTSTIYSSILLPDIRATGTIQTTGLTVTGALTSNTTITRVLPTGRSFEIGDGSSATAYQTFAGTRAFIGYNTSGGVGGVGSLVLQGTTGKSIDFNINNATFGSGLVARIDSNGRLGIATTTPGTILSVVGAVTFDSLPTGTGANSLCLGANDAVTSNTGDNCTTSLRSAKRDIKTLDVSALSMINALESVSFIFKEDPTNREYLGFIADDVVLIDPRFGSYSDEDGKLTGVDDRAILSVLVKAVRELSQKFTDQMRAIWTMLLDHESEIDDLKQENQDLRRRLELLELKLNQ